MVTTTITYILYTALSMSLTVWVGRTLFVNGRIFIIDSFNGNIEMADAVNKMLLIGFYLVNIGLVSLFLQFGHKPETPIEAIEYISAKMGIVLLALGAMHYFNMRNIAQMRRKAIYKAHTKPAKGTPVPEEKLATSGD